MVARYRNPHTKFINQKLREFRKLNKWRTKIYKTSHSDIIRDFSDSFFARFITTTFTRSYVSQHLCPDCGKQAEQRCHGVGEERPILIRRALERVYPNISKSIELKDILIAFLEEHKYTRFALKCTKCHKKETRALLRKKHC